MKDLKENIKKNNMKKLVISVTLGMFCYCTNNAANEEPEAPPVEVKNIDDVLTLMLESRIKINKAKEEIKAYEKKIYFKINVEGKVKKGDVIAFIKQQYPTEEQNKKEVKDDIEFLEQYFHLEEKKDEYECTKDNLTEIFWEKTEEQVDTIVEDEENKIKAYFKTIIDAEKAISKAFKTYYEAKKEAKKEEILKEIMKDCCGEEAVKSGEEAVKNIHVFFLIKLRTLCKEKNLENTANKTVAAIKRRITPSGNIKEDDFIYFLKQKIEEKKKEEEKINPKPEEEKKEEEKKEEKSQIGVNDHLKPKGGCPCCDC